jgi:hypothetical protein
MADEKLARIKAHRNNIDRYRWLLRTQISAWERQYIERRLSEEESVLQALAITGPFPPGSDRP